MFENELGDFAQILAESMRDVASDLRAIDLTDLVSYIRFGSYTTLEDLVHSSTELFFKPGTLTFAWTAAVDLSWDDPPSITVGMEFSSGGVTVFFDLTVHAAGESVAVCGALFEDGPEGDRTSLLERALAEARLPRRAVVGRGDEASGSRAQ